MELGRFLAIVEKLIERNFHGARHFFKRFNGGNGMAVFDARNVAAEQSGALLDIALRQFFCSRKVRNLSPIIMFSVLRNENDTFQINTIQFNTIYFKRAILLPLISGTDRATLRVKQA